MTVPTVLATTARRNWVLCSVSERPPAASSAVVIRFLPYFSCSLGGPHGARPALSQRGDAINYRIGGIAPGVSARRGADGTHGSDRVHIAGFRLRSRQRAQDRRGSTPSA